jgi:hypothetical protein
MKKDDGLLGSNNDEEEDLFDLSLDDLEPGDTIVEPHVDEPDEDIIELIDLVEKGDIDLVEEEKEPVELIETIQDFSEDEGDELKTDQALDLLDIQLDQPLELDKLAEIKEEGKVIDAVEISDSDLFIEKDFLKSPETLQTTEALFDDIADESAIKDLIADETESARDGSDIDAGVFETVIEKPEVPKIIPVEDKTIRIYPADNLSPEPVQESTLEEAEQQLVSAVKEEKVEEKPAAQQYAAPVKEEAPQMPPAEAIPTGVSEERIEAIIRKVVEEVVERVTRETMARAGERIAAETNQMVEKIARETTANVAERVITDAINTLKKSIESASD